MSSLYENAALVQAHSTDAKDHDMESPKLWGGINFFFL